MRPQCNSEAVPVRLLLEMAPPGADDEFYLYLIMPIMSGIIGWGTNWLALKMTFYPLEFQPSMLRFYQIPDSPFGLFGWQGIIPAKAEKMARKSVRLMTSELLDVKEIFSRIDANEFNKVMEEGVFEMLIMIITKTGRTWLPPGTWDNLPRDVRHEIVLKALDDAPGFLSGLIEEIRHDVEQVLNLEEMVVKNLKENKQILNEIFLECGSKELSFIERSGFYFGFLFGVFQAILWYYYRGWYILPLCGLIVGFATNMLALKMIFQPVEPVNICGFKVQGLFLKRQQEVSRIYAQKNCSDVLTPAKMWESILNGPKKDNFEGMLKRNTCNFVDTLAGNLKPMLESLLGGVEPGATWADLKNGIADDICKTLPLHIELSYSYTEKALDMETTIRRKMQGLTPARFEGVLHPVFEEDELKLILVGAVLGLAVGTFQLFVMF